MRNNPLVKPPADFKEYFESLLEHDVYPIDYVDKFLSIITQVDIDIINGYVAKICRWTLKKDHLGYDEKIKRDELLVCDYIKRRVERHFKINQ